MISIISSHTSEKETAIKLAQSLQIPFFADEVSAMNAGFDLTLCKTPEHLNLQLLRNKKIAPMWIDFASDKNIYRLKHASKRNELLIRAMGNAHRDTTHIIDSTAGTGYDALLLAGAGFHVTLIEQSPIVHALLCDAFLRAEKHTFLQPILLRMKLILANAVTYLPQINTKSSIIYLDPMFPPRTKNSAVKKEMQLLQKLLTNCEDDSIELFNVALTCASTRVVVKRPRLGKTLTILQPNFSIIGKSSRFDVYTKLIKGNLWQL